MSRRSSSRDAADDDLVALDPVTGASLVPDGSDEVAESFDAHEQAVVRARRWRRAAALLAGASLASALMAGWFGLSIRNLRGVERTWRSAMAVDQARVAADASIRTFADGDDAAARQPLDDVGDEAAARLLSYEQALDRRRILDPRVSALRDQMIEALRFRRFQMTPERGLLGDTPLRRVEGVLDDQFDRWDLERSSVRPVELRALEGAITGLRRFSTEPTRTTLAAVTEERRVLEIDVDASTVRSVGDGVRLPFGDVRLFPVADGFATWTAPGLRVFAAASTPPEVDVEGDTLLPVGDEAWVVRHGARAAQAHRVRLSPELTPTTPTFTLPPDRIVLGATTSELILGTSPFRTRLERFDPATGATSVLAPESARFLAANEDIVLWQGPLDFSDTGNGGFLHLLHLDTGKRDLIGLARTDAASAAISPDGKTIAVAAGPLAGRLGSVLMLEVGSTALVGTSGPRVAVDGPAMTWSSDSRTLFWRTPDGELAVRHAAQDGQPPQSELLRTGLQDLAAVVAFGR